jgi:hypothetical protein
LINIAADSWTAGAKDGTDLHRIVEESGFLANKAELIPVPTNIKGFHISTNVFNLSFDGIIKLLDHANGRTLASSRRPNQHLKTSTLVRTK